MKWSGGATRWVPAFLFRLCDAPPESMPLSPSRGVGGQDGPGLDTCWLLEVKDFLPVTAGRRCADRIPLGLFDIWDSLNSRSLVSEAEPHWQ